MPRDNAVLLRTEDGDAKPPFPAQRAGVVEASMRGSLGYKAAGSSRQKS